MSFQKILIPTDGSESIKAAVEKGLELAKMCGGKVTAFYVLDQSVYSNMPMDAAVINVYETLEKEGKCAMDYIKEKGKELGVEVEEKIMEGIPYSSILKVSGDYDIIVMSTLGRTGMNKVLMGSVAEKVIEGSNCPVMIVRSDIDRK
jgi:nucleotide-binding universal stress UspA family protein